ncbi:MAG TPA: MBL fold metallo-hydrolase [Chryseosolibacter sp.]
MSLFVASLNSGSNGNCYYLGNGDDHILIDGGISCRETEKRLKRLGLTLKKIKAVFITHEHGDHIHGVTSISKKYKIPVYITTPTLQNGRVELREELTSTFRPYVPVSIGSLSITGFPKFHDASDPHSFIVECNGVKVGVFTDIGMACDHVTSNFKQCHAAFLESNYDIDMLTRGSYPWALKQRIRGGKGHLSNEQAMQLVLDHKPSFMTHLFLSHLSQDNNSPKLVKSIFEKIAGSTEVIIAGRRKETKLYHIRANVSRPRFAQAPAVSFQQLSMF